MKTKIMRYITFIKEEKTRKVFSFVFYISIIAILMDLPLVLRNICYIIQIFILIFGYPIYLWEWLEKVIVKAIEKNKGKSGKNEIREIKKIAKEILIYIPIQLISIFITSFIIVGQPANQTSIEETFYEVPIFNCIYIIILGPIIEELIFRFLPYKFIKNKTLYIVVSSIIFAAMHVLEDPNPFYYIWGYMLESLYMGYRYHKTKDLLVPISIHMFGNLIATLSFVFLS